MFFTDQTKRKPLMRSKTTQRGITAIEYVVLAIVIFGAAAAVIALFGEDIAAAFGLRGDSN